MNIKIYSIRFLLFIILCINLSSCKHSKHNLYKKLSQEDPTNVQYKGHYKIGNKYKIKGVTYIPQKDTNYSQIGIASWYNSGKKTANGDKYNKRLLTAAHTKLPLPSLVKVTNLKNNKSLIVMVNDRGPFVKNRIIDVSERVAEILRFKQQGITKVKVQYLHKETQEFLKNIALKPKVNYTAKHKVTNPKCSVNCHIKLINLKHKLAINP